MDLFETGETALRAKKSQAHFDGGFRQAYSVSRLIFVKRARKSDF